MKYGLQFTTTHTQSWFNVWFNKEEERDIVYSDLQKCDWERSVFNVKGILINMVYILTVKKVKEANPHTESYPIIIED